MWISPFVHILQLIELESKQISLRNISWANSLFFSNLVNESLITCVLKISIDPSTQENFLITQICGEHEIIRRVGKLIVEVRCLELLWLLENDICRLVFDVILHFSTAWGNHFELQFLQVKRDYFPFISWLSEQEDLAFLYGRLGLIGHYGYNFLAFYFIW